MQKLHPETSQWGITDYLLAEAIDTLRGANWQRANAGSKSPKPMPPPMHRPEQPGKVLNGLTEAQILAFKRRQEARKAEELMPDVS